MRAGASGDASGTLAGGADVAAPFAAEDHHETGLESRQATLSGIQDQISSLREDFVERWENSDGHWDAHNARILLN